MIITMCWCELLCTFGLLAMFLFTLSNWRTHLPDFDPYGLNTIYRDIHSQSADWVSNCASYELQLLKFRQILSIKYQTRLFSFYWAFYIIGCVILQNKSSRSSVFIFVRSMYLYIWSSSIKLFIALCLTKIYLQH